jgi:hypothetical protein
MDIVYQNYEWQPHIRGVNNSPMHISILHCQSVSHVRKLYADLFSNYTKEVMPVYDHSKPLMVSVNFYLASINSFKEVEETISTMANLIEIYV